MIWTLPAGSGRGPGPPPAGPLLVWRPPPPAAAARAGPPAAAFRTTKATGIGPLNIGMIPIVSLTRRAALVSDQGILNCFIVTIKLNIVMIVNIVSIFIALLLQ